MTAAKPWGRAPHSSAMARKRAEIDPPGAGRRSGAGDDESKLIAPARARLRGVHVDQLVLPAGPRSSRRPNRLPDMVTGEPWVRWAPWARFAPVIRRRRAWSRARDHARVWPARRNGGLDAGETGARRAASLDWMAGEGLDPRRRTSPAAVVALAGTPSAALLVRTEPP